VIHTQPTSDSFKYLISDAHSVHIVRPPIIVTGYSSIDQEQKNNIAQCRRRFPRLGQPIELGRNSHSWVNSMEVGRSPCTALARVNTCWWQSTLGACHTWAFAGIYLGGGTSF